MSVSIITKSRKSGEVQTFHTQYLLRFEQNETHNYLRSYEAYKRISVFEKGWVLKLVVSSWLKLVSV